MRAGALKDQVTVQVISETPDTFGNAGNTWWGNIATVPTVWAAIEPLSGREFFEAQRAAAEVTHRIRIRYRADLTAKHRVTFGSRIFDVLAILEADRRRETHLLVRERV